MKILITGARGNLGRAVIGPLLAAGHTLRLGDIRAIDAPPGATFTSLDVRDAASVREAVADVDVIIHAAALHGIHLAKWSTQDFWSINATGTFNVYEAAREAGVKRIVLCSTMGVYGEGNPVDGEWTVMDESLPRAARDVYALTKVASEEIAETAGRRGEVTTVALRLGMFVPESSVERYGFRLLFGGVDDRDVAQSVLLALAHEPATNQFTAFNIMAPTPFTRADARDLSGDPMAVIEKAFPGTRALLAKRGIDPTPLLWGRMLWPIDVARRQLGYAPAFDFARFLRALEANDEMFYPERGLPWWGV